MIPPDLTDPLEPKALKERRTKIMDAIRYEKALEEKRADELGEQITTLEEERANHEFNVISLDKALDEIESTIAEEEEEERNENILTPGIAP